ncbi:MAG: zinc-ribbon domain-containing protein [Desulfovibrio sp.]|nr:zinc-ribbon domain-containing protein [Desulfovibrio sp.]
MIIVCPRCETTFSLPDELYKPGRKSRCSHCAYVFPMPRLPFPGEGGQEELPPLPPEYARKKRRRPLFARIAKVLGAFAAAVLLVMLGYGGFLIYGVFFPEGAPFSGKTEKEQRQDEAGSDDRIKDIFLEEIRQFMVDNPEGRLMVIQGLAVNGSDVSKDYIAVGARLLDKDEKVLIGVEQLCGVPLNLFQMQSLTPSQLKESLNNRINIMTNNTNIPPGGKVPCVVLFPSPPEAMQTFEVYVLDARDSP